MEKIIMEALVENNYKYRYYGIRTDSREFSVGDEIGYSRNLDETDEYHYGGSLPGTCATGFGCLWFDGEEEDADTIKNAISTHEEVGYIGTHQYLIAGDDQTYGNDKGEVIIENAVVVAVIK